MIMKNKDMQVRENLTMEPGTTFTNRRRHSCTISGTTLILLAAIFICSLLSAGFLVYNFAACPNIPLSQTTQTSICNGHHDISSSSSSNNYNVKSKTKIGDNSLLDINSSSESESKLSGSLSFKNYTDQQQNHDTDVRLPRAIIPISYNISLIPFLIEGNFTFHGTVNIHIKVVEDCYNITIHAADLQVTKDDIIVRLLDPNNPSSSKILEIKSHTYIESKQFLIMKFNHVLKKGYECEIFIKYVGYLMDYLQGFYRSSYWNGNQKR